MTIGIEVKGKIARLVDDSQYLVCGNSDYEVEFEFDEEWSGVNAKTAVFVFGDRTIYQPFTGNLCAGVEIRNATLCAIGVFAGDIKTTTGASVGCHLSITDIGGKPEEPSQDVYDQIMVLLDKAIEAHTELPVGGKAGQVLKKKSDKDYDTAWVDDEVGKTVDLSGYYTKTETDAIIKAVNESIDTKIDEKVGDLSKALDDLHQVALSYQIGDIEAAMEVLDANTQALKSEVDNKV